MGENKEEQQHKWTYHVEKVNSIVIYYCWVIVQNSYSNRAICMIYVSSSNYSKCFVTNYCH